MIKQKWHFINNGGDNSDNFNNDDGDIDNETVDKTYSDDGDTNEEVIDEKKFGNDGSNDAGGDGSNDADYVHIVS